MRGKTRVMYKCKDRREGSADLPSDMGWLGGSVKDGRMQVEKKRMWKEGDTKEMCDGTHWYCQHPKGKMRLYKQRGSWKLFRKVKPLQRTPVPCKKSVRYQYNS